MIPHLKASLCSWTKVGNVWPAYLFAGRVCSCYARTIASPGDARLLQGPAGDAVRTKGCREAAGVPKNAAEGRIFSKYQGEDGGNRESLSLW